MKTDTILCVALFSALGLTNGRAPQVPLPKTAADVPGPAVGTAMSKEYVQAVGRMAYIWGWPLVNAANRAEAFSKAPEPGLMGGVLPIAYNELSMLTGYISPEQQFVTCPNQDVVYGFGFAVGGQISRGWHVDAAAGREGEMNNLKEN